MIRLAKMFAISTLLLVCVSLHSESAAERNEQTAEHSSATEKLPKLSTILQLKLPFHYRRADLGDVLFDLEARGGLKTAFPKPLDGTFTFDFNVQQAAVNEILKRVAKAGGLELEFRNRTAVFWKPADDAELRALEILVKADKPTPGRARALEDLAQLSDPLIKLLGKPNLQHVAIDALEKIGDSRATARRSASASAGLKRHASTARPARYGSITA